MAAELPAPWRRRRTGFEPKASLLRRVIVSFRWGCARINLCDECECKVFLLLLWRVTPVNEHCV